MAFALISFGIAAIAVVVAFLDTGIDPTRGLIGLVARRRYRQEPVRLPHRPRSRPFPRPLYGRLVIIKNIFSLVLTARNMTMVIAVLVPACAGIWAILPSIQKLIVPLQYRGPFAHYMTLLLPGLCATGIIHFAVNPMFQIGKKTAPLIDAALIGAVMNGMLLVFLARGGDASSLAIAQSGAAIASLTALLLFATRTQPHWPAARDLAAIAISTCAMILLLLPLRNAVPGVLTLAAEIVVGVAVFALLMLAFDGIGFASFCGIGLR